MRDLGAREVDARLAKNVIHDMGQTAMMNEAGLRGFPGASTSHIYYRRIAQLLSSRCHCRNLTLEEGVIAALKAN